VPPILDTPDRLVLQPSDRDGHGGLTPRGIEVIDSDGKNGRTLTPDTGVGLFDWSPGGRYVLSTKQTGSIADHTDDYHVVAYPIGGGAPATLARGVLISLSPDGHRLAYSQFYGSPDTRIAHVDWTGTPRIDEDSAVTLPGHYSWGSDGTWLLFVKLQHPKDEAGDLWRVEADGSRPRQLTANVPVLGAAASPDGTRIAAWVGTSSAQCHVALLDAAGGTPTPVGASTGKPGWIGWAHRKNLLVILEQNSSELIVVDGRGAVVSRPQIGEGGRVATHMVAWGRADDAIYYLANAPDEAFGFPDVWSVGVETGDARRVTRGANVINIPGVLAR
jgi:Tol biopolymer transport system component